ncbi:hypothetical protein B0J13DRAFT_631439 [Dactylonectria estremocensis]|uniref:DUF1214 domain-containing protein n=1 Tax=Dactylonectria estremocensis TaxID=1079267 RepID=A0A9P9IA88_9HYPO|nr:hypothetical protein B0J13DRAFT_631439 [Dactylonectria estremocensis]
MTFAYYYGYPLYRYGLVVQGTPNASTNSLFHQRSLSTTADKGLNKPNVDTLYSKAFLDLSHWDLVIKIPKIKDRYWVWPFHDAYSNNVANIGALQSDPAGNYLVRFDKNNPGIKRANAKSPYRAYINIPTPYAISLVRILVQPNDADAAAVHDIQDQLSINPIRRAIPVAPPLNLEMFKDPRVMPGSINTLEEGVLKLTAKLAPYNDPAVMADRPWVSATLEGAGLIKGSFIQPKGTNLTAASLAANSSIVKEYSVPGYLERLSNDWVLPNPEYFGNFRSAYIARYSSAATGYLVLTRDQNLYPAYVGATINPITPSTRAVRITFSTKPKLEPLGFWSLSVYDSNDNLIPNDLNRYSIGDRSNFRLMDGTMSSDGGDGPFQVLIQPRNVPPPANWTSNWLPAPSDGNGVQINLRIYGGAEALVNGSYVYPVVEMIDYSDESSSSTCTLR